ncbi:MAG: copper resistance protein CopC/CopD [Anaerolineales bacterium]|nr:copper resistance protein CopC/CopD [Anaerolineales bacterium]
MRPVVGRAAPRLLAVWLALALAAGWAGVAWAHPIVVRSDPAANTALTEPPKQVGVWFDEDIEPAYAHLSVYNAAGTRVDRLDAQYVPGFGPAATGAAGIVASLPPLPTGSYVVVWRVIAVSDGHPVGGAFAFGVGVAPDTAAARAASLEANPAPDLTTQLIRYAGLLAQLVFLGAVAFRSLVWGPGLAAAERAGVPMERTALEAEAKRWHQVVADVLVGALIIGLLGGLYVQARATGVVFWELFGTRWGLLWIIRALLAVAAALLLEALLAGRRPAWLGWGLGLGLLLTTTLSSHSSARSGLLGPLADFVHQGAAALWTGGLLLLAIALISLRRVGAEPAPRRRVAAEWVTRFSGLAAGSVGALLASGLVLAAQQVQTWNALLLTAYGQTLLLKLAVAAVALAIGAYNSLGLPRQLAAGGGPERPAGRVAVEAALVALVLFGAAWLVDLPPASTALVGNPGAAEAELPLALTAGELRIEGRISPARLGSNVFTVNVRGTDGQTVPDAQVALNFQSLDGGRNSALALTDIGAGNYAATGANINHTGRWQLVVQVTRPGAPLADYGAFDLAVALDEVLRPAAAPLPWTVRAAAWLNVYGQVLVGTLILLLAVGWSWLAGRLLPAALRPGWVVVGLLLAAVAWFVILRVI